MPPWSLHQDTNASPASKISWLSPGAPENPGSEMVPTAMLSSVMPWVSPSSPPEGRAPGAPSPQGDGRVPKAAPAAGSPVAAVPLVAGPSASPDAVLAPIRAAARGQATRRTANTTSTRRIMWSPREVGGILPHAPGP